MPEATSLSAPGAPSSRRPLTTPEKYFALLDRAWPINIMMVAELDRAFPVEQVEAAWSRFCRSRVVPRIQVTPDLELVDAGTTQVDFAGRELDPQGWDADLSRESLIDYGFEQPLRCRYLVSPDHRRSRLYFVGHHSIIDGKVGVAELQWFLRSLDGQEPPVTVHLPHPVEVPQRHPWQHDNRARIELLTELRERTRALGEPEPANWPDASVPRMPRFAPVVYDADDSARIIRAARAHGARPFSTMAAAWLLSVARHVCDSDDAVVQLNTPVDVGVDSQDPASPASIVIAVISGRYPVGRREFWDLAGDVAQGVRSAIERGEGELFFHLSRLDRVRDLDRGVDMVRNAVSTAPPAVSVTNLGIIDPGSDPDWVRWMCGYQAPVPNQIAFVSGLGYRGQLVNSVSTDDSRLRPPVGSALVDGFRAVLAEMTD